MLSGNLSSGSSSSVTVYQGGIANFNIPMPVEDLGPHLLLLLFLQVLQTINIRMSEGTLYINYCSYVYAVNEQRFPLFL